MTHRCATERKALLAPPSLTHGLLALPSASLASLTCTVAVYKCFPEILFLTKYISSYLAKLLVIYIVKKLLSLSYIKNKTIRTIIIKIVTMIIVLINKNNNGNDNNNNKNNSK